VKALVRVILASNIAVGCEVETTCDAGLDERMFATPAGPAIRSIVRKQPTISQLVDEAMKSVNNEADSCRRREHGGV